MKISEIFELDANQYQLDFVDVDLEHDSQLYVDPFLISLKNDIWSKNVNSTIKNFFNKFCNYIRTGEHDKAVQIYSFATEPKDTCLGMSRSGTDNGKGLGEQNAQEIVDEIVTTNAIELGIVKNIEDIRVFVDNIDKDKISDAVSNVIRKHLIDYTKAQCDLWGIPTTLVDSYPYWNPHTEDWESTREPSLVVGTRTIVLIPKSIVSPMNRLSAGDYNWHGVVTTEQQLHLSRRSELVTYRQYKDGSERAVLPKKDVDEYHKTRIANGEYHNKKEFLRVYTDRNPEVYEDYRRKTASKVDSMTNQDISKYTGEVELESFIDYIIERLQNIEGGSNSATEYHHLTKSILELLFYPHLVRPIIEQEIHQGRKRIDILMSNNASSGFFYRLHDIHRIPCPYIFIECKNYTKEIRNPELDQLAGRFSFQSGQFGLLLCREIEDREYIYQKCSDTYKDGRGMMIPLDDSDIIAMLQMLKEDDIYGIDTYLSDIQRKIVLEG